MRSFKPFFYAACLLAAVALCSHGQENRNPNFDFSGVLKFYELADIMLQDREPSAEEWAELFNTPGYAELVRREFKADFLKKFIIAACMPSGKDELERIKTEYAKKSDGYYAWFANSQFAGIDYTLKKREQLLAAMQEYRNYPLTEQAVSELLRFLPEDGVSDYPAVAFVIFNDSRGYTPVIVSLNRMVEEEESLAPEMLKKLEEQGRTKHWPKVLFFAHEFFHHYRDKKLEFTMPEEDSEDYDLVWTINQIENEGIADQINVRQLYLGDGVFADAKAGEKTRERQAEQPALIRRIDELLSEIHDFPDRRAELGREIRRITPWSGHPTGFFMANVIVARYGEGRLVEVVRNPFRFFYLYSEAAVEDGRAPVFSEKAIALIRELEEKYALQ